MATGQELTGLYTPSYSYSITFTDSSNTISSNLYIMLGQAGSGNVGDTGSFTASWIRTRAYPPNGVMPAVSFGSVQGIMNLYINGIKDSNVTSSVDMV